MVLRYKSNAVTYKLDGTAAQRIVRALCYRIKWMSLHFCARVVGKDNRRCIFLRETVKQLKTAGTDYTSCNVGAVRAGGELRLAYVFQLYSTRQTSDDCSY